MAKGDIISRLKLESGEFDSKIKRAGQELLAYSEHCRKMGLQMGFANKDAVEFAKQLGSMATVSTTARGKINELSEAFVNAKVMYKNMTDEEKKGEFGKNLAASLDQLKGRLDSAKKDLADVQKELNGGGSKFGEFGNVLDTLGSKLGVTGNLTEMLTSKTALLTGAVGAGIAVVTKSTEAWAKYNNELAKQDQVTQVTTGLKGDDADRMTDKMRALSDTYNVDFREAVNAANTLMTQFGKTGDEATQLIKDGMQGMIQGDGPKLLSMIQQYAPAFRDAGVSASQLVAVIQNSEGGIFTDQNMNAIVMGIKNIRLMTDATSQALAKMGIDGKQMSEQLSNGTLTIFDALKQVSRQLQTVDSNSKTAGEVMQQVFGRQGVTAGTNLAKAIETLNTDLEQTKVQTGEVGDSLADLQEANEKLNTAIRDCFEYDGWEQMANGIKSKLITALAAVIDKIADIKRELGGGWDTPKSSTIGDRKNGGGTLIDDAIKMLGGGNTQRQQRTFTNQLNEYNRYIGNLRKQQKSLIDEANSDISGTTYQMNERTIRNIGNMITAAEKNRDEYMRRANDLFNNGLGKTFNGREWVGDGVPKNPQKTDPVKPNGQTKTTTTTPKPKDTNFAPDSIMAQEKLVAKLTDQYKRAGAAVKDGIKKQLDEANKKLAEMQGKKVEVEVPNGSMAALTKELQNLQKAQQLATTGKEWREYEVKMADVKKQIAILKGELPKGETATITVSVDADKVDDLRESLNQIDDKTMKVTVDYADNLEDVSDEQRTVTFTADDRDVLAKVANIKGITIDPKTLVFTANDSEVLQAATKIQGVTIDQKTLTVIPQTTEAAKELMKLNTFTIADKQIPVTVMDDKAMKDLQAIAKVAIPDKEVKVKVSNPKAVDVKVNEVAGSTVTTANVPNQNVTVNYKTGIVDLEDIPDEKNVKVNYETTDDLQDIPDEERKVTFTADDSEVIAKVANIKGITIDPKTLVFTANDSEALQAAAKIQGVTIDEKTMTVKAQTLEAAKQVEALNGIKLDTKTLAIKISTDDPEVLKTLQQKLDALGLSFNIDFKPKEPIDKSLFNEQKLNAKIAEIKKNVSGLTIGSQEWIDLKGLEADATAFSNLLQTAIKNGMDVTALQPEEFWKKIFGGTDIATSELQTMLDQINAYLKEKGLDPIKLDFKTGEIDGKTAKKDNNDDTLQEFTKRATEFVGGLSSVASGLNKLGVELPEGVGKVLNVIQGVTEVINGINAIIQSTQVGAITANTAAVTANTAALGGAAASGAIGGVAGALGPIGLAVGGVALLGSVFGLFHNGGIVRAANGYEVPGNYGYDAVPALLTSGELVLNRAQQGVLADALGSNGSMNGNLRLETYVSGRDLRIVLNNESQGRLKGKYVTSNKR